MSSAKSDIAIQLSVLPDKPGVYQYFDETGKIIYVGKAKNLKKRVSSYFTKNHDNAKVRILVSKIREIRHIVVDTESDALLLENNLIKQYQPRYNILLKDDKTYPWIVIKNEPFPRVYSSRRFVQDGSLYFGPFTSSSMVRSLLHLIKELYPLRTCALDLSDFKIKQGRYKPCLEAHLGNCLAPCVGEQLEEDYRINIDNIKDILKGNLSIVIRYLKEKMDGFASSLLFEDAENLRRKWEKLKNFQSKSSVVSATVGDLEVFSVVVEDTDSAYLNFLRIIDGCIVQSHSFTIIHKLDETPSEILAYAIVEMRERKISLIRDVIVPFLPEPSLNGLHFIIPERGDKLKLLDLSEKNARFFMLDQKKQESLRNPREKTERILTTMKNDLQLDVLPEHIECFDNSNLQGTNPVAACVVFKQVKPAKKDYRHFNVKTVVGPDDFASMREIIYRRYSRMLEEKQNLPQLIVIDGGKGQLSAAVEVLDELKIRNKVIVIGIAKRLEEIFFPDDPNPIYLDKKSETLKVIQQIRDEAHRFGITFHRNKRSKGMVTSSLLEIPGIGDKTYTLLIRHFGSLKRLEEATIEDISELVGEKKATLVKNFFEAKL
jgi:excinuclease ABC subunit C